MCINNIRLFLTEGIQKMENMGKQMGPTDARIVNKVYEMEDKISQALKIL